MAGHELGHSIWESERFSKQFEQRIEKEVINEITNNRWKEYNSIYQHYKKEEITKEENYIIRDTWINACTWTLMQIEEIFCDIFGLRLFAESYLYAFAYLISPGLPGPRSLLYPNIQNRVSHMLKATKELDIELLRDFDKEFIDGDEPSEPATKMLVSIADDISESLVPELIQLVQDFATKKNAPKRDRNRVQIIKDEFHNWVVPTARKESLVDILNAGWECEQEDKLWRNMDQIQEEDRSRILRDLILKSMEISEILERLGQHHDS